MCVRACVRACVCVFACVRERACVCVSVRAWVRARACECVCVGQERFVLEFQRLVNHTRSPRDESRIQNYYTHTHTHTHTHTKSQVCLNHCYNVKNQPSIDPQIHNNTLFATYVYSVGTHHENLLNFAPVALLPARAVTYFHPRARAVRWAGRSLRVQRPTHIPSIGLRHPTFNHCRI